LPYFPTAWVPDHARARSFLRRRVAAPFAATACYIQGDGIGVGGSSAMKAGPILLSMLSLLTLAVAGADEAPVIAPATTDEHGIRLHRVQSSFQTGETQIRVLLPGAALNQKQNPVIYVLPVEARNESRYGDGLLEIKRRDLHQKHQIIFVAPTFSDLPWYADHPAEARIRQETYFLNVVLPFIEKTYSAQTTAEGRLLLGFSKSGWGAWSLLLRHPDVFGRAAAWDAPLMMQRPGKYGTAEIFGSPENFEEYRITGLLHTNGKRLGPDKRLILVGHSNFREDHEQVHALMDELRIPHAYQDGPQRKHDWHSGWVPEAVELLVGRPQNR
jgi:S-formylglutathione hydrolase FrmB